MITQKEMQEVVKKYDSKRISIGCLGSHSALNTLQGCKENEKSLEKRFPLDTYAFCQKERDKPYSEYFVTDDCDPEEITGVVDYPIILPKFSHVLSPKWKKFMKANNIIFVPNRSFWCYCGEKLIQTDFDVPMFGARHLLHLEDREKEEFNYYNILQNAGVRMPEKIDSPEQIKEVGLAMVKIPHAVHELERGFFTASSKEDFEEKVERLIKRNIISEKDFPILRIERFSLGPVCNFNLFYSPVTEALKAGGVHLKKSPLETMSTEWRFESNLDGFVRLPAEQQLRLTAGQYDPTYIVVGHASMTLRESLLNPFIEMGEKFIAELKRSFPPGMIGPFGLQCVIEDDMKPTCYDVAFRIPGGDNITMYTGHPYLNALWGMRMSTGRRIAWEIRRALKYDLLDKIVT